MAVGWSRMPIDTKKNVLNSSRRGTISPSTLAVRSESASASPATKAPSAMLTPSSSAANAVPIAMTATLITNSSRERRPATIPSRRGRKREPATTTSATKPMATAPASTRPRIDSSSRLPRAERATTSTTVSRSCTIDTPRAVRPCVVVCSVPSPATLKRTTVDATAIAPPMNSASSSSQPISSPVAVPMAMVMATCTGVPARIRAPTERSSPMLNWRPMLNMRSATPMSASASTSSRSATKPGVKGPTTMPAAM